MTSLGTDTVDWHALAPFAVLCGTAVAAALTLQASPGGRRRARSLTPMVVALAGLTAAAALFVSLVVGGGDDARRLFGGRFVMTRPAAAVGFVAVLAGYGVLLVATRRRESGADDPAASIGIVAAALGVAGLAAARDAALGVVALELVAVGAALACSVVAAADPAAVARARLSGVVAFALEAYAVGVMAVVAGGTRLSLLGARLRAAHPFAAVIAVVCLVLAVAARAGSVAWLLRTARGEGGETPPSGRARSRRASARHRPT